MTALVVLYDTFFARLFALEPSMRGMFEDNMIRQSKFLVGLVNIMVRTYDTTARYHMRKKYVLRIPVLDALFKLSFSRMM